MELILSRTRPRRCVDDLQQANIVDAPLSAFLDPIDLKTIRLPAGEILKLGQELDREKACSPTLLTIYARLAISDFHCDRLGP